MNTLLFRVNKNESWRALYGDVDEDSRMMDLELILRFFTLNSHDIYNSEKKKISLKQAMNRFMQLNMNTSEESIADMENEFCTTIHFIHTHLGEEAFFNLQNDLSKIRRRLYPTVFDSIMIATTIALSRGFCIQDGDLRERRIALLKDTDYRESITQGTMKTENIRTRISLALRYLYDIEL